MYDPSCPVMPVIRARRAMASSLPCPPRRGPAAGAPTQAAARSASRDPLALHLVERVAVVDHVAPRADEVQRPALDLVVDAPHVLAQDAQRDQLHAAEEEDGDGDGGEARQ